MVISSFVNRMGLLAREKGYRPGHYRLAAIILWCLGELAGLFCGLIMVPLNAPIALGAVYLCALVGAGAGAGMAFLIIRGLKPVLVQPA